MTAPVLDAQLVAISWEGDLANDLAELLTPKCPQVPRWDDLLDAADTFADHAKPAPPPGEWTPVTKDLLEHVHDAMVQKWGYERQFPALSDKGAA
jgi:hypothetical protein